MSDSKSIEARIAELRGELRQVEGTPTEVYSRIVGYYRSVRNWNAGKREEYGQRKAFGFPGAAALEGKGGSRPGREPESGPERRDAAAAVMLVRAPEEGVAVLAGAADPAPVEAQAAYKASTVAAPDAAALRDSCLVFTREACPNCSPVANYVLSSGMKAVFVDVDREEGLALARDHGVLATPTVVGLDGEGRESYRAFDVAALRGRAAAGPREAVETGSLGF
jgi:hypothetical protein